MANAAPYTLLQRSSPPKPYLGIDVEEEDMQCPKEDCDQSFEFSNHRIGFMKLHLANNHYYVDRIPLKSLRPVDDDGTGWVKDDRNKTYSCNQGCKRKMGYRELYVHICNVHDQLEWLMMDDPSEKVQEFMRQIYPPAGKEDAIKGEKCD